MKVNITKESDLLSNNNIKIEEMTKNFESILRERDVNLNDINN